MFNILNFGASPVIGMIFALVMFGRGFIVEKLCGKIESIYFWILPCFTFVQIWII